MIPDLIKVSALIVVSILTFFGLLFIGIIISGEYSSALEENFYRKCESGRFYGFLEGEKQLCKEYLISKKNK